MTSKCLHGDDILALARKSLAVSLSVGIAAGILLCVIYGVATRYLPKIGKQSTKSSYVAPRGGIQSQTPQPWRHKITGQTSNATTSSGLSDDQGGMDHRYPAAIQMLPKPPEVQQRERSRAQAQTPGTCVSYKKKPPHNYNPHPNQYNEESEIYENLNSQSQPHDEQDTYITFNDIDPSQTRARVPGSGVTYSNVNRHRRQDNDEPTYENFQNNSPAGEEYDYVSMPCVGQAVANLPQTNQGYLLMGAAPPIPPR